MKTIKKQIEVNKLVIEYDEGIDSPREWSNLGYFITVDNKYRSPDDHDTLINIVRESGQEATSCDNHMEIIKKEVEDQVQEKVLAIYPVVKYEHGGVSYSLGQRHGFDYSNNGFYIVTEESRKELGTKKKILKRL